MTTNLYAPAIAWLPDDYCRVDSYDRDGRRVRLVGLTPEQERGQLTATGLTAAFRAGHYYLIIGDRHVLYLGTNETAAVHLALQATKDAMYGEDPL